MAAPVPVPWEQLFPTPPDAHGVLTRETLLVCKQGEPLLLLPADASLAKISLALYPAQTRRARCARSLLGLGLTYLPGLVATRTKLALDPESGLVSFLTHVAQTSQAPRLAMLLGNPRAPGRRFVLLLFREDNQPAGLVKAGVGEAAVRLIEAERGFLQSPVVGQLQAAPLRGEWQDESTAALAMDFVVGDTPPATADVSGLLNQWLQTAHTVTFPDLTVARRLDAAAADDPRWNATAQALRTVKFHPAIHHGDFAPWNVRVGATGQWHVLDWERGEADGPPAWDWFHWLIQPEVLVRRADPDQINWRIEQLLRSAPFQEYAQRAGIAEIISPLLVAYLLYCVRVTQQADGRGRIQALLSARTHPATCTCHHP